MATSGSRDPRESTPPRPRAHRGGALSRSWSGVDEDTEATSSDARTLALRSPATSLTPSRIRSVTPGRTRSQTPLRMADTAIDLGSSDATAQLRAAVSPGRAPAALAQTPVRPSAAEDDDAAAPPSAGFASRLDRFLAAARMATPLLHSACRRSERLNSRTPTRMSVEASPRDAPALRPSPARRRRHDLAARPVAEDARAAYAPTRVMSLADAVGETLTDADAYTHTHTRPRDEPGSPLDGCLWVAAVVTRLPWSVSIARIATELFGAPRPCLCARDSGSHVCVCDAAPSRFMGRLMPAGSFTALGSESSEEALAHSLQYFAYPASWWSQPLLLCTSAVAAGLASRVAAEWRDTFVAAVAAPASAKLVEAPSMPQQPTSAPPNHRAALSTTQPQSSRHGKDGQRPSERSAGKSTSDRHGKSKREKDRHRSRPPQDRAIVLAQSLAARLAQRRDSEKDADPGTDTGKRSREGPAPGDVDEGDASARKNARTSTESSSGNASWLHDPKLAKAERAVAESLPTEAALLRPALTSGQLTDDEVLALAAQASEWWADIEADVAGGDTVKANETSAEAATGARHASQPSVVLPRLPPWWPGARSAVAVGGGVIAAIPSASGKVLGIGVGRRAAGVAQNVSFTGQAKTAAESMEGTEQLEGSRPSAALSEREQRSQVSFLGAQPAAAGSRVANGGATKSGSTTGEFAASGRREKHAARRAVAPACLATLRSAELEGVAEWTRRCAYTQQALASAWESVTAPHGTMTSFIVRFGPEDDTGNTILVLRKSPQAQPKRVLSRAVRCLTGSAKWTHPLKHVHVVIARSTRALRRSLTKAQVEFTTPLDAELCAIDAAAEEASLAMDLEAVAAQGVPVSDVSRVRARDHAGEEPDAVEEPITRSNHKSRRTEVRGSEESPTAALLIADFASAERCIQLLLDALSPVPALARGDRSAAELGGVPLSQFALRGAGGNSLLRSLQSSGTLHDMPQILSTEPFLHASALRCHTVFRKVSSAGQDATWELRVSGPIVPGAFSRIAAALHALVSDGWDRSSDDDAEAARGPSVTLEAHRGGAPAAEVLAVHAHDQS